MSFGSGSTKNIPLPDQSLLGQDPRKLTTNEAGRAVPLMYGKRRVGVTLLTQAFDISAEPVTEKFGKKSVTTGHRYGCSFAALVCQGPVDYIEAIYFDRVPVWPEDGGLSVSRDLNDDKLVAIDMVSEGAGYTQNTTNVVITGDGSGAAAVAVVDPTTGSVRGIRVTSIGSGYTSATVSITGSGVGAIAAARVGTEPFVNITIPGFGVYRLYWGTDLQGIDPELLALSGDTAWNPDGPADGNPTEEHGAYAGQCYLVGINHQLGINRQNLQNIEVVVGRWPTKDWLENSNRQSDCSVPAIIADIVTNPRYGIGLDDAGPVTTDLNRQSFLDVDTALEAEGVSISPLIDRAQPLGQMLAEILEYCDGYFYTDELGRLSLGLVRAVACGDGALPIIDETALVEAPSVRIQSHDSVVNEVKVRYTNRFALFNDDSTPGSSLGAVMLTGRKSSLVVNRDWITRPELADYTARVMAKVLSTPKIDGTFRILESKLQGLKEGSPFYLNLSEMGSCFVHCRVIGVTRERMGDPALEIKFEVDRNFAVERTYVPTDTGSTSPNSQGPKDLTDARVLEMPYDPVNGEAPMLGFLAARPSKLTRSFNIHLRDPDLSFGHVQSSNQFVWHGTLSTSITEDDEDSIRVILDNADRLMPSVPEGDAAKGRIVAFVNNEIMSLFDIVVVGANEWSFSAKREWMDTKRAAHLNGDDVWITWKEDFRRASYYAADAPNTPGSVQTFKLQPVVGNTPYDLSLITNLYSVTFSNRAKRPWKHRELTGPSTFNGSTNLTFGWTPNPRDETNTYLPDFQNPITIVDLRRLTDPPTYPTPSPIWRIEIGDPNVASVLVNLATMTEKFGSIQSFVIRIYTLGVGNVESMTYLERTVTLSP